MPDHDNFISMELEGLDEPTRDAVMSFRLMLAIGTQLRTRMDQQLAPAGLTTQQAILLSLVASHDSAPTQGEVARQMGVSHQNVRQLVDALCAKGLMAVREDATDRRIKRLQLTPKVKALFKDRNSQDFDMVKAWFGDFDQNELHTMVVMLLRLYKRLEQERASERHAPARSGAS